MKRALGLLTMLALLSQSLPAHARNIALIVTVGQFAEKRLVELPGAQGDGDAMRERLIRDWHFAPTDVHLLRDAQATRANILAELDALLPRSAPGDTVVVYYAGHGTSPMDAGFGARANLPYATGAWVPYDFRMAPPYADTLVVGRRDLVPPLKRLDEGGRFVVVISDSCYSGQIVRGLSSASRGRMRTIPLPESASASAQPAVRPPPPPYPYRHVLMLSAASDSEPSTEYCVPIDPKRSDSGCSNTVDHREHGVFTDALLRLMDGQLGDPRKMNYAAVQQALDSYIKHAQFAQTPGILPTVKEDAANVASRAFLAAGVPEEPAPPPAAETGVLRVQLDGVGDALRTRIAAIAGVSIVRDGADLGVRQDGGGVTISEAAGDAILHADSSDAAITARIAAEAWLRRNIPERNGSLGLRAETSPGSFGGNFKQCEQLAFAVRTRRPAWLMLLDVDSHGELALLYPQSHGENVPGPADQVRLLAADTTVTPPFGTDVVTVIALPAAPELDPALLGRQPFASNSEQAMQLAHLVGAQPGADVRRLTVRTIANPALAGMDCP